MHGERLNCRSVRKGRPAQIFASRRHRSGCPACMKKDQEAAAWLDTTGLPVFTWGLLLRCVPSERGWFLILKGICLGSTCLGRPIRGGAWDKRGSKA